MDELRRALHQAVGLVGQGAAAAGVNHLDSHKYSGTATRAEITAAALTIGKVPAGALAVVLDAEPCTPSAGVLLVDASVPLTNLGRPDLALAFLES